MTNGIATTQMSSFSDPRPEPVLDRLASLVELERWPAPMIDIWKSIRDLMEFPEYKRYVSYRSEILADADLRYFDVGHGVTRELWEYLIVRRISAPVRLKKWVRTSRSRRQTLGGLFLLTGALGLVLRLLLDLVGSQASGPYIALIVTVGLVLSVVVAVAIPASGRFMTPMTLRRRLTDISRWTGRAALVAAVVLSSIWFARQIIEQPSFTESYLDLVLAVSVSTLIISAIIAGRSTEVLQRVATSATVTMALVSVGVSAVDEATTNNLGTLELALIASTSLAALVSAALLLSPLRREISTSILVIQDTDGGISRQAYAYRIAEVAVRELNLSISKVHGARDLIALVQELPQLTVSDPTLLRSSPTYRYVEQLLASHSSGAFGLAGHRGAGKSTIMSLLHFKQHPGLKSVLIESPVKYEGADLTRWIVLEVCREILAGAPRLGQKTRKTPVLSKESRLRLLLGTASLLAACTALVASILPTEVIAPIVRLAPAIGFLLLGLAVLLLPRPLAFNRQSDRKSQDFATELLEKLSYELESESSLAVELPPLAQVGLTRSLSQKRKTRELTTPELARSLHDLLVLYTVETGSKIQILIDELDKISQPTELIATINGLKDIFKIPRVHFIVTVSDEALSTFERRGFFTRDAFDSAFDLIVRVEPPTAADSIEILRSRTAGYPPILAALCHAWSGGIPRDTIRFARRIAELSLEDESAKFDQLALRFIREDLHQTLSSLLKHVEWHDSLVDLVKLRPQLLEENVRASFLRDTLQNIDNPEQRPSDESILVWLQSAILGLDYLMFLGSSMSDESPLSYMSPTLLEVTEVVAGAFSTRYEPFPLWYAAFLEAVEACRASASTVA